mmetsp:Transcript_11515/g.21618  ORF Transcript_11515/g.21618 Transcript_11515/m.21618 type:complete len:102 (-) Transcript_11515:227-532(-)
MAMKSIATGKYKKAVVFRGSKAKTSGGLTKADLKKNKNGKIVSKKASARAKSLYKDTIGPWVKAVSVAKKELGITGCVYVNSPGQGRTLYKKAKEIYACLK